MNDWEDEKPPLRRRARIMVGLVVLLLLFGVVMAMQSKAVQVLEVSSGSMEPTLQIGDRILVDAGGLFDRFSVIVLQDPEQPGEQIVKRIVGLGGDKIEIRDGILYINGEEQYSAQVSSNRLLPRNINRLFVPDNHLFILGDNRNDSYDSLSYGPVSEDLVHGVLTCIIWPPKHLGGIPSFVN